MRTTRTTAGLAAATLIALAGLLFALQSRGDFAGQVPQLKIDLGQPDALIQSRRLSALPRDLVALPGLSRVLTQDFALYYEEHPDRLTLEGTLRRLAFDHGLSWQEKLAAAVLDAPATVALWSDGKGRLAYAAVLLERNAAARTLEQLGKVALPDSQLTVAGTVKIGGNEAKVYALKLSNATTLLAVSSGERLLVLTHPGMLLDADRQLTARPAAAVRALLEGAQPRAWLQDFALAPLAKDARHAVNAKAGWLSFGYQHFFPQVHAARFELTSAGWSLGLAAAPAVWKDWPRSANRAWSVLPRGAAFCAALPVTWERAAEPLASVLGSGAPALTADLLPGAGACWYPVSGLYAPMVALRLRPGTGAKHDAVLRTLLQNGVKTPKGEQRAVAEQALPGGRQWSTDAANAYGYRGNGATRGHRITVLRQGDVLLASVDHRAIEQAQAVHAKAWPALADDFPGAPLLLSTLPDLSKLLQAESVRLTSTTPAFRQQVQTQLKPRLDAMGAAGRLSFVAPAPGLAGDAKAQWQWKTLVPAASAK